jgi:uncharacterized membrane protein
MKPDRMNAFTDGVFAVVITLMVLELRTPETADLLAVRSWLPLFGVYLLSFVNIGIFWNNHHHMMYAARRVDGRVLWANLGLMFWLSLIPLVIRWIDEAGMRPLPVASYGLVLIMAAIAYVLLEAALLAAQGPDSPFKEAIGSRFKEWLSFAFYLMGMLAAFVSPLISIALYVFVSSIWLIPDRRFARITQGSAGE